MDLKNYVKIDWNKWYLQLKVIPNSKNTEFFCVMDDWTIKIKLKAIPEKWKANKELIEFLSKELNIKKTNIMIISWAWNREKIIRIDF